jgi:hypothetical protein
MDIEPSTDVVANTEKSEVKSNNEGDEKFAMAEYKEAAAAYFKGVDIGYTTLKNFFAINVIFITIINLNPASAGAAGAKIAAFINLVPAFGILICVVFMLAIGHYFRHLENCRLRCEEIEKSHGGQLFSRMGTISNTKKKMFSTGWATHLLAGIFIVVWGYMLYVLNVR